MPIATVKKSVTKGEELVIITRQEYERLVSVKKSNGLEQELLTTLKEAREGKLVGPFASVKELKKSIEK